MKPNRWNRFLAALRSTSVASPLAVVILGLSQSPANSATLTWDVSPGTAGTGDGSVTGGNGTWDTTAGNWTANDGETNIAWVNNASPDNAIFDVGPGGTVTQDGITVRNITFNSADYTIASGTLTLAGASPTIRANANATISSILAGTEGMTKAGGETLTISTPVAPTLATYTGGTTVTAGILNLATGGEQGAIRGALTINSGAQVHLSANDATGWGTSDQRISAININGGTLRINTTGGTGQNQTFSNLAITMNGGTISGAATGSTFDFFNGGSSLTTLASAATATVSARAALRQANTTFTIADGEAAVDLLWSGPLAESGGGRNFIKAGDGRMHLTGAGTWSGSTAVSGGTLHVANQLRNTSAITVGSGATLELGATNIFVGSHGTALADSRIITVDGGTLLFNSALDTRFGSVTLNNGATWTSDRGLANYDGLLANTASGPANITVGGDGMSVMNGTGGIHLQGVQNFVVADTTGDAGDDLRVNMILAAQGTSGGDPGGINKTGAGTMALNAANTYTGATIVGEGTLRLGATGTIAASSGVTVNGATLQADAVNKQFAALTLNSGSTLAVVARKDTQSINVTGDLITNGAITLRPTFEDSPRNGEVYDIASSSQFTDGGTYTVDLSARGATRVTATAEDDGLNFLVLNIGTGAADLIWNNNAATGIWNNNADANFNNGGTPDVFMTYDAVTFGNTAAGAVTLDGTLYPGTVTVDSTADYTFTGSGSIAGGSLVKDGSSTLKLENANAPSSVTLKAGTLDLANAGGIGDTGTLTLAGGTLHNSTGDTLTIANPQVWDGDFSTSGDALVTTGAVVIAVDGEISVGAAGLTASGALGGGYLTKKGPGDLVLSGTAKTLGSGLDVAEGAVTAIAGTGISTLQVGGSGSVASFTADSNNNGNRLVNAATVIIGNLGTFNLHGVNTIPNHANSCNFTVEAGGELVVVSGASPLTSPTINSHAHAGNLILNGGTVTLDYSGTGTAYNGETLQINGSVTVGGTVPSAIAYGAGAAAAPASVNGLALDDVPIIFTVADVTGDDEADLIVSVEIENSDAVVANDNALVKKGDGTLLLAGNIVHTYTGPTAVDEGTLIGTGSIPGALIVATGGTVATDGSFGTGSATLQGTYACEIDGPTGSTLNVTGNLEIAAGATLALSGTPTAGTYIIATWTGDITADFDNVTVTGLPDGYEIVPDLALKRILVTNGSGNAYDDWATANGVSDDGPGFDSDGDGILNYIEFVLGGDPSGPDSNSAALLPAITDQGGSILFSFHLTDAAASLDPAVWSVEFDDDLAGTWTTAVDPTHATITITPDGVSPETGEPWQRVDVTLTKTTPKRFVRLRVNIPTP